MTSPCSRSRPSAPDRTSGGGYAADERDALSAAAVAASLGCGNPTAAELREGERVLDLSSGGIDVLLSARRVGPTGKAYGLNMTEEMPALALANASKAGATNVEFLKGTIEAIPLPANTIDVVISNCVINLSTNKPAVFAGTFRIPKPGGRIVVADDTLTPDRRAERGDYVGCTAGLSWCWHHRVCSGVRGSVAAGWQRRRVLLRDSSRGRSRGERRGLGRSSQQLG